MNNARAIQIIDSDFKMGCGCCIHPSEVGWCDNKCQSKEAINMAIEALSKDTTIDDIQYEWIVEHGGNGWNDWCNLTCPKCGKKHEKVPYYYNLCPNCGARMKSEVKDI